ncbi:MAG: Rrf2 family transcriptional regulator [Acidimicrobiia bacterium]|nr:Rrf2 family transcriptional regulator [Acidimicrobiia bacterium]
MLKLSKKVDYGLMSLMHLAQSARRSSWSAREIAENYRIPLELLAKILQKLVQKGLLVSHPGTHGGYSLSRPAAHITAAEVIEAIEGPLFLTNCVSDDGLCGQFEKCNLKSPLQRLNDIVVQTFRNLTIEEMSQQQSMHLTARLVAEPQLVSISGIQQDV